MYQQPYQSPYNFYDQQYGAGSFDQGDAHLYMRQPVYQSPNTPEVQVATQREMRHVSPPKHLHSLAEQPKGPEHSTPTEKPKKIVVLKKPTQPENEPRASRGSERKSDHEHEREKRRRGDEAFDDQDKRRKSENSKSDELREAEDKLKKAEEKVRQLEEKAVAGQKIPSAEPQQQNQQQERKPGSYTIPCMHWGNGLCKKGDACFFVHDPEAKGKNKMPCQFEAVKGMCINRGCMYSHTTK